MAQAPQPIFYYDLGSPTCYLAAEQVMNSLPMVPEWEPVLATELQARDDQLDRIALQRRARELGLQELRWPPRWPPDTRFAMLAATYAKSIGRAVAFSLAAFRQAFAGAQDLGERDTVLIAAASCELHPAAVLKGVGLRSVSGALADACARARGAGVTSVPSIAVGSRVYAGDRVVEDAARALGGVG